MDYQPINELVEKYFRAETTREEEALLVTYFQQPEIDPALEKYRPLFAYLKEAGEKELSAEFEVQLLQKIAPAPSGKVLRLWPNLAKVAAALLLAVATWWFFVPEPTQQTATIDWSKYEPATVEEAYEITRSALRRTSRQLNNSAERAAKEVSKVQDAGQIFK